MDRRTFNKLRELIYRESGIALAEKKEALVRARIGKRMRALGIREFRDYYSYIEKDTSGDEIVQLLDAISTNVTHFFREPRHFEVLTALLKKWQTEGRRSFRIWCAASSSGEEPYTIAITGCEALGPQADLQILATDISTKALEKAKRAVYAQRDVKDISRLTLMRYFQRGVGRAEGLYRVKPHIRRMVRLGRLNLAHPPFHVSGPIDVVFCRNVMIYFDNVVRRRLLENMFDLLQPDGVLMVGHSESLTGIRSGFKSVEPAVYIKDLSQAPAAVAY